MNAAPDEPSDSVDYRNEKDHSQRVQKKKFHEREFGFQDDRHEEEYAYTDQEFDDKQE